LDANKIWYPAAAVCFNSFSKVEVRRVESGRMLGDRSRSCGNDELHRHKEIRSPTAAFEYVTLVDFTVELLFFALN